MALGASIVPLIIFIIYRECKFRAMLANLAAFHARADYNFTFPAPPSNSAREDSFHSTTTANNSNNNGWVIIIVIIMVEGGLMK